MNRVLQPRPLVVLGLTVWMGTAAGADELVEVDFEMFVPHDLGGQRDKGVARFEGHAILRGVMCGPQIIKVHRYWCARVLKFRSTENGCVDLKCGPKCTFDAWARTRFSAPLPTLFEPAQSSGSNVISRRARPGLAALQGYLAHKKQPLPTTLQ